MGWPRNKPVKPVDIIVPFLLVVGFTLWKLYRR
jgi:hypothetical protein